MHERTDDLEILATGMAALGLDALPDVLAKLLDYRDLLMKWNRAYNLTAVKDPQEAIVWHLLDSLAILPWVGREGCLLDVGSGGGLPGIPLAIASPSLAVTLVDSIGKKVTFQRQAAIELGLANVKSWQGRIEDFSVPEGFDRIVSRAFADLAQFVTLTRPLLKEGGCWLAMKGKKPDAEIAALPKDVRVEAVIPLAVPGLAASRHLLILRTGLADSN